MLLSLQTEAEPASKICFFYNFYDGQSTNKGDCVKSKVVSVHDMKQYGKYTYSSMHLTAALDKDEWSASHPGCSMPEKVAVGSMVYVSIQQDKMPELGSF